MQKQLMPKLQGGKRKFAKTTDADAVHNRAGNLLLDCGRQENNFLPGNNRKQILPILPACVQVLLSGLKKFWISGFLKSVERGLFVCVLEKNLTVLLHIG